MILLRENIYDRLRSDILACRFAPGDEMRAKLRGLMAKWRALEPGESIELEFPPVSA